MVLWRFYILNVRKKQDVERISSFLRGLYWHVESLRSDCKQITCDNFPFSHWRWNHGLIHAKLCSSELFLQLPKPYCQSSLSCLLVPAAVTSPRYESYLLNCLWSCSFPVCLCSGSSDLCSCLQSLCLREEIWITVSTESLPSWLSHQFFCITTTVTATSPPP